MERDVLWCLVIKAIYREDGGLGSIEVAKLGWVWVGVVKAGLEIAAAWVNFTISFKRKIGKGQTVSFWRESWIGNISLEVQFPKLVALEEDRGCAVADQGRWVEGEWRWC